MINPPKVNVGDEIEITIRGTAEVADNGAEVISVDGHAVWLGRDIVKNVRVIEPPVTVFGPGDTVRNEYTRSIYTICADGYFDHSVRFPTFIPWSDTEQNTRFTSEHFEKVNLKVEEA